MTFFFDNHLTHLFVEMLKARGDDAIHLQDRFSSGADDVDWISEAARHGWVVITADHKIHRHRAERLALKAAGIIVFFCDKDLPRKHRETQMRWLEKRWEAIEQQAAAADPGDLYEVPWSGPIRKILKAL